MKASDEQLVEFIDAYCREMGFSPSVRDMCRQFGYASPSTIQQRLMGLRERGLVTFEPRLPRTVRVVRHEECE